MSRRIIQLLPLSILFLLLFISCGAGKLGWGVILWSSDNQQFTNGAVVLIMEESRIKETYTIRNTESKSISEFPRYLIRFFKKRGDAEAFAEGYGEYAPLIAVAEKDGLPVRETPEATGTRIYRLMEQQVIKVIGREQDIAREGELEGYWYEILTDDGVKGFCFSPYLTVLDINEEGELAGGAAEKTPVSLLLEAPWRPEFFAAMISRNAIDLNRLKREYGLFPDSKKQTIRLHIPDHTEEFTYSDIVPVGKDTLRINNTPLEVTFIHDNKIEVIYSHQDKMFNQTFVRLNETIDAIISGELEYREEKFTRLTEKGTVAASSAYGTITFAEYPQFIWENFKRLVPEVIPQGVNGAGILDFNIFLDEPLKETYDGALKFNFTGIDPAEGVRFLYTIQDKGIRLTFVPAEAVDEHVVMVKNPSPIVLFFSYIDR